MGRIHKSDNFYQNYWDQRRQIYDRSKARGEIMIMRQGSLIHVSAPIDQGFREAALAMNGSWRPKTGLWSFPENKLMVVANTLRRIYGNAPTDRALGAITSPEGLA